MSTVTNPSEDWVGSTRASLLAWGLPHVAIVAGLFAAAPVRAAIWTIALAWMGSACILNARRCGRTHCHFTGPYYLATIIPVIGFGSGAVSVSFYGWVLLGAVIVGGGGLIWWLTERVWGRFS